MKEEHIRPARLFDRYLEIALDDAKELLSGATEFDDVACPGCAAAGVTERFDRHGFEYRCCAECRSLYLSPRPSEAQLGRFYSTSKAVAYFATHFYKETEDARRRELVRPKAEMTAEWARRLGATDCLVDVGAGYGTYLEETRALGVFDQLRAVEPAARLAAVCRDKGFDVIELPAEAISEPVGATCCTCFEVLEHVHDPLRLLGALKRIVRPGGMVLFTTLTASGFDIVELWRESKSVMPPSHLNLLTTTGLRRLVERAGLELVDLSTPGRLDVDILANALRDRPELPVSRFARQIVEAPEPVRQRFQRFLQHSELSSHVRVVARHPDGDAST